MNEIRIVSNSGNEHFLKLYQETIRRQRQFEFIIMIHRIGLSEAKCHLVDAMLIWIQFILILMIEKMMKIKTKQLFTIMASQKSPILDFHQEQTHPLIRQRNGSID